MPATIEPGAQPNEIVSGYRSTYCYIVVRIDRHLCRVDRGVNSYIIRPVKRNRTGNGRFTTDGNGTTRNVKTVNRIATANRRIKTNSSRTGRDGKILTAIDRVIESYISRPGAAGQSDRPGKANRPVEPDRTVAGVYITRRLDSTRSVLCEHHGKCQIGRGNKSQLARIGYRHRTGRPRRRWSIERKDRTVEIDTHHAAGVQGAVECGRPAAGKL